MAVVESSRHAILFPARMNFDRLAPHYHWLEIIFAGGLMQRCRTTYLTRTKFCRRALLVGEGTGRFLVELLRWHPQIRITCIEPCEGMIKQMRQRIIREGLDDSQINFQQVDVLKWTPPKEKFDLIVTNFFLDCFRAGQLLELVPLAGMRLASLACNRNSRRALLVFQDHDFIAGNLDNPPGWFFVTFRIQTH